MNPTQGWMVHRPLSYISVYKAIPAAQTTGHNRYDLWAQGAVPHIHSPRQNTPGIVLTGNHPLIWGQLNSSFLLSLPAIPNTDRKTLVSKGKGQGHQKDQLEQLFACTMGHYPAMTSCFALRGLSWRGARQVWLG